MYLDPGLGSMIVQIVIAALATAGAALVFLRNRITGVFKKKKQDDAPETMVTEAVEATEEPKHE